MHPSHSDYRKARHNPPNELSERTLASTISSRRPATRAFEHGGEMFDLEYSISQWAFMSESNLVRYRNLWAMIRKHGAYCGGLKITQIDTACYLSRFQFYDHCDAESAEFEEVASVINQHWSGRKQSPFNQGPHRHFRTSLDHPQHFAWRARICGIHCPVQSKTTPPRRVSRQALPNRIQRLQP